MRDDRRTDHVGQIEVVEADQGGRRRTVAVLGQMYELGEESAEAHREVGRLAIRLGIDTVITVGGEDAALLSEAALGGPPDDDVLRADAPVFRAAGVIAEHFPDREAAARRLNEVLEPGDVVLIKGSNGVGLSGLGDLLAGDDPGEDQSIRSAPPSTGSMMPVR